MRALVVGVGNPARGDDSVGLVVAREVRDRLPAGSGVDVEELWAGGLRLAEALAGYDAAVVVDAMETGRVPPGHVAKLPLGYCCAARAIDCVHDATLESALAFLAEAGERMPARLALLGIEVRETSVLGEGLTPEVAAVVGLAADAVLAELESWR